MSNHQTYRVVKSWLGKSTVLADGLSEAEAESMAAFYRLLERASPPMYGRETFTIQPE